MDEDRAHSPPTMRTEPTPLPQDPSSSLSKAEIQPGCLGVAQLLASENPSYVSH